MESKNYKVGHHATQGEEQTLLQRLHLELYNLKFLIVVDDVWDTDAWDRIAHALPDKENGNRILFTTRLREVTDKISKKSSLLHEMQPLGLEHSWQLLCYLTFGDMLKNDNDDVTLLCPPHMKEIGRSIAKKCKGFPLSLVAVGGLLIHETEKNDFWKMIEENIADAAAMGEGSYMEILALSYIYLPTRLQGFFYYLGAFPEDCEICASKLIKLWVAEDFFPELALPTQTMDNYCGL